MFDKGSHALRSSDRQYEGEHIIWVWGLGWLIPFHRENFRRCCRELT